MFLSRNNTKKGDTAYIITLNRPDIFRNEETGDVTFQDNTKGTNYIKCWKPDVFDKMYPHLSLKPGEGPYPLSAGVSRQAAGPKPA